MNKTTIVLGLVMSVFMLNAQSQVMTACLTMEQSQAEYNRQKAASIVVVNTATQQTQCYYQQLATYYQQLDKDNQQKAKDTQQIAKDAQQVACASQQAIKEAALIAREKACAAKEVECAKNCTPPECNPWKDDGCGGKVKIQCGEKWTSDCNGIVKIDGIPLEQCLRMKGEAAYLSDNDYCLAKNDYKNKHPECK